jgi:hypothetical protein
MKEATFDPAKNLTLYLRQRRTGSKKFIFLDSSSVAVNISAFDFELHIKEYAGARTNVIALTVGAGLTVGGASSNELTAAVTVSETNVKEGKYYWELYKGSTDRTYLCGKCIIHNGEFDGVTEDEETITIDDGVSTVTIAISDGGSLEGILWGEIGGTVTDQTDVISYIQGYSQPLDDQLSQIAGITPNNDGILQVKASAWVQRTLAEFRADLQSWVLFPIHAIATGAGPITLTNMPNTPQMFPGGANVHGFRFNATFYNYCRVSTRVSVRSLSANDPRFYLQYSIDNGSNWLDAVSPNTTASGNAMSLGTVTNNAASGVAALVSGAKGDWLWRVVHDGGDGVEDPQVCNVYVGFRL